MLRSWCAHRYHWSRGPEQTCKKTHRVLYGTPTFDVSFKRALAAKQPKKALYSTIVDPIRIVYRSA